MYLSRLHIAGDTVLSMLYWNEEIMVPYLEIGPRSRLPIRELRLITDCIGLNSNQEQLLLGKVSEGPFS